jgi:nucleotide-binding universal stress UspA family protein
MFNRILVTMDNSDAINQTTFKTALDLAKRNSARLMLLNVLTPDRWDNQDMDALKELHKTAKREGLASDVAQLIGDPDALIRDMASRWGADLIVLGQPNGKTSQHIQPAFAKRAPCSVMIAQQPDSLHLQPSQTEQFAMMN